VWDVPQVILVLLPAFVGIAIGCLSIAPLGIVLGVIYSRVKSRGIAGNIISLAYWYLPTRILKKCGFFFNLPDSHERDLLL
jgi:type IV conjugative transfer system protein TraL